MANEKGFEARGTRFRPVLLALAMTALWLGALDRCRDAPAHERAAGGTEPGAFEARVAEYLSLHRELEARLPRLGNEATPEEIDRNQRQLEALVRAARPQARRGDFFTPAMQDYLRRQFAHVFSGKSGQNALGEVMDENPGVPELAVNERYPDSVPLSTMPPEVLEVLPALEEDMEYRFVGRRLVLLDAHAHLIVDFTDELLPS